MTDPTPSPTPETIEAEDMGERPDLGRTADTLREALTGSGVGSDTRAGSLQGGVATGSDDDPDQREVDRQLAERGRAQADAQAASQTGSDAIANTGVAPGETDDAAAQGDRGDDADAATG